MARFKWRRSDDGNMVCDASVSPGAKGAWLTCETVVLLRNGASPSDATAAAFRAAETRVVSSSDLANGALAVPLMRTGGCAGVFAIELQHHREQNELVRAVATILAAQLATLLEAPRSIEVLNRKPA